MAIVLAAALATACGGGDDDSAPPAAAGATATAAATATAPTLESAAAAYGRLREKYNPQIDAINARVDAAGKANEPRSVAIALDDLAQILDEGRTDFDAIEFPSEVHAAAEEFARALSEEAATTRRFSKDLNDRDARDGFIASLARAQTAGEILRQQLGTED